MVGTMAAEGTMAAAEGTMAAEGGTMVAEGGTEGDAVVDAVVMEGAGAALKRPWKKETNRSKCLTAVPDRGMSQYCVAFVLGAMNKKHEGR